MLAALLGASAFFGVEGQRLRGALTQEGATVNTGDLVTLVSVTDADSIVVRNPAGEDVPVRLLGIKALEGAPGKDALTVHATVGKSALERALEDKPIRVLLGTPPKDKHNRSLATLYVDDVDVGLRLVRDGHVLVYTPYPFLGMQHYLDAQAQAKSERKGLWADDVAAARADALLAMWRKEAP
jgi:endonuclease YncB( thermonuclease family)